MKTITFRPLRYNKKLGKIIVASYMQWRKVKTADYNVFSLIVNDEYNRYADTELVYNHKGEQLFWNIKHPDDMPIFEGSGIVDFEEWMQKKEAFSATHESPYILRGKGSDAYITGSLDCDGVPTFSHKTANEISIGYNSYDKINEFEPLTVKVVKDWFGWFLYQLQNSKLQIGK